MSGSKSFLWEIPVYAGLDLEECVDAGHCLKRDGRYLMCRFALAHVALDRLGAAIRTIEFVVAATGIHLRYDAPCEKMRIGMGLLQIPREVEECRRRRAARDGTIIANVGPYLTCFVSPLARSGKVVSSPCSRSAAST